jgi:hypothetical protein
MNNSEVKWLILDSADGERTLKQHAFIPKGINLHGDVYIANISACGKIVAYDQDEKPEKFIHLDAEPLYKDKACGTCRKLLNI